MGALLAPGGESEDGQLVLVDSRTGHGGVRVKEVNKVEFMLRPAVWTKVKRETFEWASGQYLGEGKEEHWRGSYRKGQKNFKQETDSQ